MRRFVCSICGHNHEEEQVQERCPHCGALSVRQGVVRFSRAYLRDIPAIGCL